MSTLNDVVISLEKLEENIGKGNIIINPVFQKLQEHKLPIIIYGAGALGHEVYDTLYKNSVISKCFCSGLNGGYVDKITGLQVIRKSELMYYNECIVIFAIGDTATKSEKKQLKQDIIDMGFQEEHIMNHSLFEEKVSPSFILQHKREIADVYDLLSDEESKRVYLKRIEYMVNYLSVDFECNHEMYIDDEIVKFDENEIMIDAGAYNGDTALLFRQAAGKNAIIYSFEPDTVNYTKLIKRVSNDYNIYPEKFGLWMKKTILSFSDDKNGSSHIQETGITKIEVTDLDSYCIEKNIIPSYIKMDIEGTEYVAISGAKETLEKYMPKLAICLYHKPEDIYELPLLIHRLNPKYKLYIRHYSDYRTDTLLYAV